MIGNAFNGFRLASNYIIGVLVVGIILLLRRYLKQIREYRAETLFGNQHGCKPITAIYPCKWPLGLDILRAQYKANAEKRLLAFQQPFLDRLGPNFEVRILGTPGYTTFDPENIEAILSSRFEDYYLGTRRGALFPFIGEGIFTQDSAAWKHSRELLRRPFLKTHYQNLQGFDKPLDELAAAISSADGMVDLQPLFFRFTLATTTTLIFGQPIGSKDEQKDDFAENFDYASMVSALRSRLVDFYWAYKPSRYTLACKNVKDYADSFVHRALGESDKSAGKDNNGRYAFVEDLYHELQDPVLVRDQLVNVLLAGRDTTACLLSWTFFLLVRHPKTLSRLKEEIQSIMGNEKHLTKSLIQRMPFLKCVLNETLRLYPPIPINVRFARRRTWLPRGGGLDGSSPLLIRRGLGVGFPVYYMHRRRDLYGEDAMDYRPERWEGPELADVGWGYLPFHGGHRLCLGKDFALTEASCAVVRIIREFPNIRLPPEHSVVPIGQEKQELTVFLKSAEGCKILV